MKKINRFPTRRIRDWVLIALGFAVIFGSGFAASKILEDPKAEPQQVSLNQWEERALSSLRDQIQIRPEQEDEIGRVLAETQIEIKEAGERASLEFHLRLLESHAKMSPHLDTEQRQIMRRSSEALAKKIREKFSDLLKEQNELEQGILLEDDLLKHITP